MEVMKNSILFHEITALELGQKKFDKYPELIRGTQEGLKIPLHPVDVMRELGIRFEYNTTHDPSDKCIFWNCSNIPENLPPYLELADLDPQEFVGFGLSQAVADSLFGNKKRKKVRIEYFSLVRGSKAHINVRHCESNRYVFNFSKDIQSEDVEALMKRANQIIEKLKQ